MTDQSALPPAGWYPDPESPGGERWWNGVAWSEERRAVPPPPAVAAYGAPVSGPSPYAVASDAAPYGAPAYGAPAYGASPYGAPGPANTPALVGFILSAVGLGLSWLVAFLGLGLLIGGLITSIVGLRKARALRAQGFLTHRFGLAVAGVVIGGVGALGALLFGVLFAIVLGLSASTGGFEVVPPLP